MFAPTAAAARTTIVRCLRNEAGRFAARAIPAASAVASRGAMQPSFRGNLFSGAAGPSRSREYATSTTPTSSPTDPAELEAQRYLDEGTGFLESGEVEKAKAAYEHSLTIKENSSAFFNLGVCHYHARDLPAAIKCWKSSLRLSPESPDAHTNLASAYVLSQPSRPDLAVKHLKTAASIAPEDPEIAYNLAAVLEACEQLDDALKQYRRAYEGGIQRADQNIRNVSAKLLSKRAQSEGSPSSAE